MLYAVAVFLVLALFALGITARASLTRRLLVVAAAISIALIALRAPALALAISLAAIAVSFIERTFAARREGARPSGADNEKQKAAARLLGVALDASEREIRAAHRALIVTAHPDAGGAAGRAARLNEARDALIAYARHRS